MSIDTKALLKKGTIALNLGNPKESKKYFEKILEIEPNNIDALLKLGNIFGKYGNYKNAIICYDKILFIEQNKLALINKGLALHYLEYFFNAINRYNLILNEKHNSSITLYYKASSLIKLNKIEEGVESLHNAIKLDYSYKEKALLDIDFQNIKNNVKFRKITS